MAEDKKSFVLYSDLIHTVKKMPKDKAGELLLIILEYVNDLNPKVEDLTVDLVFEPIKQQLKRDLSKYQDKKKQWSEAGKKSAEVKANKRKKRSTDSTNVKGRSTDSTVSVNVNVNDNVIKSKEEKPSPLNLLVKDLHPNKVSIFKEWITYRKEIKKPLKIESTVKALIKKFNANPIHVITHVVNLSIENNWTGLFWEKYNNNNDDVVGINGKRLGAAPTPLN